MTGVIDLRSDTLTLPTHGMRRAIASAAVGDDQRREDPTTRALEERVAALLGCERALFVPSATMANQIALAVLAAPGDALFAEPRSHIVRYELGGAAAHAGLSHVAVEARDGRFDEAAVRRAVAQLDRFYGPRPRVICVENTHADAGGTVWRPERLAAVLDAARRLGLRTHLDGARLFNAATALGVPVERLAAGFDTITICLSKGLGCPAGALLVAQAAVVDEARRLRHRLGGGLRQSGILAAAGLFALERHATRLGDDHANAAHFAQRLRAAGASATSPETNIVLIDGQALGGGAALVESARRAGVLLSRTSDPTLARAVFHLGITDREAGLAATRVARSVADMQATLRAK